MVSHIPREKVDFLLNDVEIKMEKKIKLDLFLTSFIRINSKMTGDLYIFLNETIQILEEHIYEFLCNIKEGKICWLSYYNYFKNPQVIKNNIKVNFNMAKTTIRKIKLQIQRKNICSLYNNG